MGNALKIGLGFGLTSGAITTLGLIVGLNSGTHSKLAVIGGILIIAFSDAFADALGIHISEEAQNHKSKREILIATFSTFLAKLIFASTFILPVLIFPLQFAIYIDILWGMLLLTIVSLWIAKERNEKKLPFVFKHLSIAILVVVISNYLGKLINYFFQ